MHACVGACYCNTLPFRHDIGYSFLLNHFQTQHASCSWWEEEPWFWVKSQGQFWKSVYETLDYSYNSVTFKLHTWVVNDEWKNYWYWVTGLKVKVKFGTRSMKHFCHNTDSITFKLHTYVVDDKRRTPNSYWFWVTEFKVMFKFSTLSMQPCGHDTDYSICSSAFKFHS